MSPSYCRFCESSFVSGRACRNEKERDRCGEWMGREAAREYWESTQTVSEPDSSK